MFEQLDLFEESEHPFKITKPIRLIEFFAGVGFQRMGIERTFPNATSWRTTEWAVPSILAYDVAHNGNVATSTIEDKDFLVNELFNLGISVNYNDPASLAQIQHMPLEKLQRIYAAIERNNNLVNIMNVKGIDLNLVDYEDYTYVLTYSFPCFTADTLVLTNSGYKQIVDIKVDDYVLSHDNKYHKVVKTFNNGIHNTIKIIGMGVDEITTTLNHKFYVREMYRKGHYGIRTFKAPEWVEAKDLTKKHYLGVAINNKCKASFSNDPNVWWLIGRYIGDGWTSNGATFICCDKNETQEITSVLDKTIYHYSISYEKTANKIRIVGTDLFNYLLQFGKGASYKHLTNEIIDLPVHLLKSFIEGYLSADGCKINDIYKLSTTSRELAYGFAQCVAKVYHTPYRIYKIVPKDKKVIEERLINQKIWYQVVYKINAKKQDKAFYNVEDGCIWFPIKSISENEPLNVYDIEVEDSHSFTANGVIAHNCQDLSLAGSGNGYETSQAENENQHLDSGVGTRSGLVWEVIRILKECKELGTLPHILVMENVTQVHGLGNVKEWHKLLNELSSLGYANFWKDMNGKNYGIPQNRDRTFMISILDKDAVYHFPKKVKLKLCLGDLLEKNVDEKYFLSKETVDRISSWKGFENPLEDINRDRTCSCLTTHCGKDSNGMQLVEDEQNLKQQLCNELIEKNLVKEGDCVNHSYSNSRMDKPTIANNDSPGCSPTLTTRPDTLGVVVKCGNYSPSGHNASSIVDPNGLAPTVMENHGTVTAISIKNATQQGYLLAEEGDGIDISSRMESHRGTVQKGISQTLTTQAGKDTGVCVKDETMFTETEKQLFTEDGNIKRYIGSEIIDKFEEGQMATTTYPNGYGHGPRTHDESIALNTVDKPVVKQNLRIRKLTPLECWRLMGADDMYFYRLRDIGGLTDAQIYHIAGDGLIVNIPQMLFETMK